MALVRMVGREIRRVFRPRVRHWLAVIAVTLVGGWLGLLVGGNVTTPIGPVDAELSVRPSLTGDAVIDIPPLGTLSLDTTDGPLALHGSVKQVRVAAARQIFNDPSSLQGLESTVVSELKDAMIRLLAQSLGCGMAGAAICVALVFRRGRTILASVIISGGVILVSYGIAAASWNPKALEQPKFTGVLATAPSIVGSVESIATHFTEYSTELANLVTNVSRLYAATSTLPTYQPDPNTIRVLHISDIHLNPAAWDVIRSTDKQFKIDFIIDTGDLTDHGSKVENRMANEISTLHVPYVFVKGNHDSKATVRAVKKQRNSIVLQGDERTVDGMRLWGIGDPRFTPDKQTHHGENVASLTAFGQQLRPRIDAAGTVDVALTHDPTVGRTWDGLTPLVLAGHLHHRENEMLSGGTRLMVGGSTGGAGLRALDTGKPTPVEMDVLYFSRRTHRLQAWDEITLGGLGLTSAQIQRHAVDNPNRPLNPIAGESPTPTITPTPSGSETPYSVPPSTPPPSPSRTRRRGPRRQRGSGAPSP